ncbi:MAG: tetratricopeptide repeat protein [Anaerolineales bacterium]|nr:tetratricopeptide repeat protein [Anaerolineales bacterium]
MSDLEFRKQLGRSHLNANKLGLALSIFAELVEEYPDDVESHIILGDCYLAGADYQSAQQLYQQALQIDPDSADIIRRLQLTQAELLKQEHLPESFRLPTSKDSLSMLLQELTGRTGPVADNEIRSAADLLQEMVNSSQPAEVVARHLDQIDVLLPALLELNIKQAEADGKPDLAAALQILQENIQLQKKSFPTYPQAPMIENLSEPDRNIRLLIIHPAGYPSARQLQIRQSLQHIKTLELVDMDQDVDSALPEEIDLVLAFNPHTDAGIIKKLADLASGNIPVVLDLETDFENLPIHHPQYPLLGLGTAARAKTYSACLSLADVITTPSYILGAQLKTMGHETVFLPDGWDPENPLWQKESPQRQTINIGWIGSPGYLEDIASVRRSIVRILREFPQTQLVISGDPQVYQLFDNLPEYRRVFLPQVDQEDFPSLLAQLDIRLVPMRNTVYNRSSSDRPLLEAGIRKTPWIASPIPAFKNWAAGGRILHNREDWYTCLKTLIQDPNLIRMLGYEGFQTAQERSVIELSKQWQKLLVSLMSRSTQLVRESGQTTVSERAS